MSLFFPTAQKLFIKFIKNYIKVNAFFQKSKDCHDHNLGLNLGFGIENIHISLRGFTW